ncbi:hypothetical protein [Psychrobacter sp. I-STPA10]|uniref:hypothetical protein n=1 Tax=Psychrobacter sp. I-STPA10 TaxID=2585769 RepID=UPI001E5D3A8E|nr:hypothetical protein [Psychrobacter sp. I-STPA10]
MNIVQEKNLTKYYYHNAYLHQMDIFIVFVFLAMASAYMPTVDVFFNWWQATHWLGYVCVIFLIWNSVNNYWGKYWQLTDNSLNYYFSFIRVKHILLADISHVIVLEQQESSQKLKIYCSKQDYDSNKPKAVIDSKYCLDFSILVQRLKNKLPQLIQGDVYKKSQKIECYQKKNRKVSLLIWSLFWLIIIVKICWQRTYVAWDIKYLFITGLIIILIGTCIHIYLQVKGDCSKDINNKVKFLINQYILPPVLFLYLLLNIYIYVL